MPPDGGTVRAQNAPVEPFISKVMLNTILKHRVPGGPLGSNGLLGGHTNLNGGHPGLGEDITQKVVLSEVFFASFHPQVVQV